jgi:outer membrane PBP1 activator LpoA protein
MNTEFTSKSSGAVVVLQVAPDEELQLEKQKAATPASPAAQMLPPELAKVTDFRPGSAET